MKLIYSIVLGGVCILSAMPSKALVLDFVGDICNGGMTCGNFDLVDQSFGDVTGVNVVYDSIAGGPTEQPFSYFDSTLGGGLTDVIFTAGSGGRINFIADPGFEVSLGGLDIGTFGAPTIAGVNVFDLADNSVLFSSGFLTVASGAQNVAFSVSSTTGLSLQFAGDFFNTGADNIVYDATKISDPMAPVPLPAAGWLLIAGVATLFGLRRARTA